MCSQIPSSAQVLLKLFITIFMSFIVFFSSSISLFEFFFLWFLFLFLIFFYEFYFFLKLLILCICCFPDFVELSLCCLVAYWVYKNNSDSLELRKYLLPLVCAISLIFAFLLALRCCLCIWGSGNLSRLSSLASVWKDLCLCFGPRVLAGWGAVALTLGDTASSSAPSSAGSLSQLCQLRSALTRVLCL